MKKQLIMMVAALAANFAVAKGVEQISIVENEITTISVPFSIKSYTPSNKDVIRFEAISDTSLRITAVKRGRCDLEVRGDNGFEQKFEIMVLGDLATILDTLTLELDQVQEVRTRIIGNSIRVDGEISSIEKWEYLMKVLKGYGSAVRNFATFSPAPEVRQRLANTLKQAGFEVLYEPLGVDRKAWPAQTIALVFDNQTHIMSVQGKVFTPEQKDLIIKCLSSERWLSLKLEASTGPAEDYRVRGLIDIFIDTPKIRISVAYMAINEDDITKIGNPNAVINENGGFNIEGAVQGLLGALTFQDRNNIAGGSSYGHVSGSGNSIMGNLGFNTRFFKRNGISRISDTGYAMMESWAKDGAKFKSGGTLYVKVAGRDIAELKEIPWGFTIDVKGGMVNEKEMSCEFDFGLSTISLNANGDYDRLEDLSKQKITLPIGRTTLIGGIKKLLDDNTPPSGLPILRNTPLLNWFVSDSGKEITDRRLVIMVCPEIVEGSQEGNLKTDEEINIPVTTKGAKSTEQLVEEKKPFHGFWYWLNWFTF